MITFISMKNLILVLLIAGSKANSQKAYSIPQIDSIVAATNRMTLALNGGGQEAGAIKNFTWFHYDSTTNELRKVVQLLGHDKGQVEMVFYYSGSRFHKFSLTEKYTGKKAETGSIYYSDNKVLRKNIKQIDSKATCKRGKSFVALFAELKPGGFNDPEFQKKFFLSAF